MSEPSGQDVLADTSTERPVTAADQPSAQDEASAEAGPAAQLDTEASNAPQSGHMSREGNDNETRAEIEREASEALARRADEMSVEWRKGDGATQPQQKTDLPDTPPPPMPPRKDIAKEQPRALEATETEFDEKHPPVDPNSEDLPQALPSTNEATGAEIDHIMTQFQGGTGGTEEEIMSTRLDRQQPILQVPPRTSSLEAKEKYTLGAGTNSPYQAQSPDQQYFSPVRGSKPPSVSGASLDRVQTDDRSSIHSAHAASIFQPPPPSPSPELAMPFDFHRFLEQLRHRTADPVARFLRSFLQEFGKRQWAVHEQVKIISDFLEFITKKMSQCEVWRSVPDAEFDNAREGMEKLVMNRLYTQTFSPAIPLPAGASPRKGTKRSAADAASPNGPGRRGQHQEDVERDEVIAQKLRIYGWISEEHLDIRPIGDKGRKFLLLAQQELLKINTYRAPRDKVICVLNACKVIFGFLRNAKEDQSADAFVPLLIYTVLRARPEHLASNVQYIWRFRNADKLGGEAGYYMSSLMGVVTFIENLDRTNLNISDEEFERNVEAAVSAIAEGHEAEEYELQVHNPSGASTTGSQVPAMKEFLTEKSGLSRAEVTPRNSMDAERSSPRRHISQRLPEKAGQGSTPRSPDTDTDDDTDAVTGLLRTIQKPLSSIGRIFSDDGRDGAQQSSAAGLRPASTPLPGNTPRGLSPAPRLERRLSADGRSAQQRPGGERRGNEQRGGAEGVGSEHQLSAEDAAARQASAEAAQAQRVRAREEMVVVETLQSMFPNLDKEVIVDVVRAQEGNVGRAVDACLALSG